MKPSRLIFALALCAATTLSFADTTLRLGDKAPAIKVLKWIKGQPVTLGNGNVNVVEFWATWCGPCKKSIPHLTELAHKYQGKVTFTGVSVSEVQSGGDFGPIPARVAKFVKDMGATMSYTVAMDGPEGTMSKTWMDAAGQDGIPTAFVIDRTGRVAWIGHPMDGLDAVLDKVLANKWDIDAEAKVAQEKAAVQEDLAKVGKLIQPAIQTKNNSKILAAFDEAMTKYPRRKSILAPTKMTVMFENGQVAEAMKYGRETVYPLVKTDPMRLNQIAWMIVEKDNAKDADYDFALKVAQEAVELTKKGDPSILDTLGLAYYRKGQYKQAIETEELAVALAAKASDLDVVTKKEFTDRLAMFKKKG